LKKIHIAASTFGTDTFVTAHVREVAHGITTLYSFTHATCRFNLAAVRESRAAYTSI
jgi:hypothetical protein